VPVNNNRLDCFKLGMPSLTATDIGCIKAAISLAKVFDADYYKHEIDGRFAEVVKRKCKNKE
jgi:hypothetical protein